mmetsp:Transcript_14721/g.30940  ORF Transcript_14721/g.30940 Transcript_14721/m.30940 type:complete len:208 (+) Transcript_14721:1-624(+)
MGLPPLSLPLTPRLFRKLGKLQEFAMTANNLRSILPRSNAANSSSSSVVSDLTTYTDVTCSPRIIDLISKCRWVALREVLEEIQKKNDDDDDFLSCSILGDEETNKPTDLLIHRAIRNGAPKSVLMLLARRFPDSLFQTDDRQRYPLHVACEYGASASFIFHCVHACPVSVCARDKDGRKPVKILCDKFVEMRALERRMDRIACALS